MDDKDVVQEWLSTAVEEGGDKDYVKVCCPIPILCTISQDNHCTASKWLQQARGSPK